MKINFYLTQNRNMRDGVTHYAHEIIKRIPTGGDLRLQGDAFITIKDKKETVSSYFKSVLPSVELNIKKTPFRMRTLDKFTDFRMPFSYEKIFGTKPDVVVFFHNFLPRIRINAKKVVVIHDLTPLYQDGLSKKKKKIYYKRYLHSVKNADLIFTDSEYSKADICNRFPVANGKIIVNYCGIDNKKFSTAIDEAKRAESLLKYNIDSKYILFMGQARENKNLFNLIKAYSLLPDKLKKKFKLVLANSNKKLIDFALKIGIDRDVVFLNGIEESDVVSIYQSASLLALVSFSEGFGLPLVEAMAAGIPVIASNVSCLPEVAGGAALLVNPYEPADIAAGMAKALTDAELRNKMIEKGKVNASKFSWEITSKKFYSELIRLHNNANRKN